MRQTSLRVILLVVLGLVGKTSLSAAEKQVKAAAALLGSTVHGWKVHEIDQSPSVAVDGRKGYRIVLRRTWKEPPAGVQARQQVARAHSDEDDDPTYVTRHADWHFVLVPVSDTQLAAQAKREILWHVPDEMEYHLPVALGDGHGFAWFSYISIHMQHFVRTKLKLTGGDDPLELALRGLWLEEGVGPHTSVSSIFGSLGDRGFAALDRIIRQSEDISHTARRCKAIGAMSSFQDARATARLVELYSSSNQEIRKTAEYALISRPLRREAAPVFLEMIRNRTRRLSEAIEISVQLDLKDAAPLVGEIVNKPTSLWEYLYAYRAYRALSGKPIDAKLIAAERVMQNQSGWGSNKLPTPEEIALARSTILESSDVGGAAYVAFSLSRFTTKGNNLSTINKDGIEILRQLPRPMIEKKFQRLLNQVQNDSERTAVLKLFQQVTGKTEVGDS